MSNGNILHFRAFPFMFTVHKRLLFRLFLDNVHFKTYVNDYVFHYAFIKFIFKSRNGGYQSPAGDFLYWNQMWTYKQKKNYQRGTTLQIYLCPCNVIVVIIQIFFHLLQCDFTRRTLEFEWQSHTKVTPLCQSRAVAKFYCACTYLTYYIQFIIENEIVFTVSETT